VAAVEIPNYYLAGVTTLQLTPLPATVRVLHRTGGEVADGEVLAKIQSGADGAWRVDNLNPEHRYDVVGRLNEYNDVILAGVSPALDENPAWRSDRRLLPAAAHYEPYTFQLVPDVATGATRYSVIAGSRSLPEGITLDKATGVLSGTVAPEVVAGYYTVTVEAYDAVNKIRELFEVELGAGDIGLLLHYEGADNGMVFTEETGKAVDLSGTVVTKTDEVKVGEASARFNGTGGYLQLADHADLDLSTTDFTIECWEYLRSLSSGSTYGVVISKRQSGDDFDWGIMNSAAGAYFQYYDTLLGNTALFISPPLPFNEWTHLAICRRGDQLYSYCNGVEQNRVSVATNLRNRDLTTQIGLSIIDANYTRLNANLAEMRITLGVARYSGDFTPPTEPSGYTKP
jgi:hypothetical protein